MYVAKRGRFKSTKRPRKKKSRTKEADHQKHDDGRWKGRTN